MVRGPGIKSGQLKDDLVLNIDLAPTMLDLAGITPPNFMDGQSFKPMLLGAAKPTVSRTDFLVEHQGEYDFINPGCPQYDGQPLNVSVTPSQLFIGKCVYRCHGIAFLVSIVVF